MLKWRVAPHDSGVIARITRELRCAPLLAQVLAARGVRNGEAARKFLERGISRLSDPETLPGAAAAAERILAAIRAGRRITIYGDYDVDGVTGTSILWHCLKLAGAQVDYYIPCRFEEGYGLNCDALRQLHAADPQRLLITVDCGIASLQEAAFARSLGLELIITDHHTMAAELPEAAVLVHPRLPGHSTPFGDLCGAGVAFKLAWAVCKQLGDGRRASPAMREFLKSAVGLAALGTVGDVVPLRGENRILVCYGLQAMRTAPLPGLSELVRVARLSEKAQFTAEDIGFALAPRINAAGRLGQARLAVELLTTENVTRAAQIAQHVDELNKMRQSVERKIFRHAREMVETHDVWCDQPALVLAHADWHVGVIGIVAGRIAEHFERPAVLIALDEQRQAGQGSGRSYGDFDLHSALNECAPHLERYGGHRAAAGLYIRAERVEPFREAFNAVAARNRGGPVAGCLDVDAEVQLADLTHRAVRQLEALGPFGCEHPRPVLVANRLQLVEPPRRMGGGGRHLSLRVRQGSTTLRCVAFGKGDWADELAALGAEPISICFSPGMNEFQGYATVELQLLDWQPAAAMPVRAAAAL